MEPAHVQNSWGAQSLVVDSEGRLLQVFRGQHGSCEHHGETLLGSLSFGSLEAANTYALSPNSVKMALEAPKVFPVYLDIQRPFVHTPDDPFMDLSHYERIFGLEETRRLAVKFEAHIMNTNAWDDVSSDFETVQALADQRPDLLMELCLQLYPLLDDAEEVARLKAAGFDGAIHAGSGETMLESEYRVFSPEQVKSIWDPLFARS